MTAPAAPGRPRMIPCDAIYLVRGYTRPMRLALETWHKTEASKNIEVETWRSRSDCVLIEVEALKESDANGGPVMYRELRP